MKRQWAIIFSLSLLTLILGLARAQSGPDVLSKLGVAPAEAREAIVEALATGTVYNEPAFAAFRALAPSARASLVKAGLAWVKEHIDTPDFKAEYAKYREGQKPSLPKAVPTVEEFLKKQRQDTETAIKEWRKLVAGSDDATRKWYEQMIKNMEAQQEAFEKDPQRRAQIKDILDEERARNKAYFEEQLTEWDKRTPADPRTLIALRIREFLEASADVDYSAELVKKGKLMRFADEGYESKSKQWKLCYRAGKEAVEAARAFATAWLSELEKK
ncbi:MAG: hypothetical protein AB1715_07460 [Acidobacteriota bacterium]